MIHKTITFQRFIGAMAVGFTLCATPALAVTDWARDGRLGYMERETAERLARSFTERGAPFEGQVWRIVRDPDGGWTPVFRAPLPLDVPTS